MICIKYKWFFALLGMVLAAIAIAIAQCLGDASIPSPVGDKPESLLVVNQYWGVALVIFWSFLIVFVLAKLVGLQNPMAAKTLHWALLNYASPFLFIIVPLVGMGFFQRGNDWFDKALFPSANSLWSMNALFFMIIRSELEKMLAHLPPNHQDMWKWHNWSEICQMLIFVCITCLIGPLFADFYGAFGGNYQSYKTKISVLTFLFATVMPIIGIIIMKKIHHSESNISTEKVHP